MNFDDVANDIESIVLTPEQIAEGIARIARGIEKDHVGVTPLLIGVLKGAVMVMADVARELHIPIEMDWMAVSSYGKSTRSSGVVRIVKDLDISLEGRHVVVVEDIVDTGHTVEELKTILKKQDVKHFKIATLFLKPDAYLKDIKLDYVGIRIPNKFIVGYGLDYNGLGRNLRDVYQLAE
jgi:hypoxanthine phosphoribosyltransferase